MESESGKSQPTSSTNLLYEIGTILQSIAEKKTFKEFRKPVDEEKDGAPGYYALIKKPMDLKMMALKLKQRVYKKPIEIFGDLMLICQNCKDYYKDPSCSMREKGAKLEEYIEKKWKKTDKQLKKEGIDIKTAGFDYSKISAQPSLEQSISNTKESVRAPKSPTQKEISIKNSFPSSKNDAHGTLNQDISSSKKTIATNIPDQASHTAKIEQSEKSAKNKQEAKTISEKENFIETLDGSQNKNLSKYQEPSVFSEFDSDKETSLTRKFSDYSDLRPTKGFIVESESKESQKMPTQNISYMSIEDPTKQTKSLWKNEKIEEELVSPFNSSVERMIDNFDQDQQELSNSRPEVIESSNLPLMNQNIEINDNFQNLQKEVTIPVDTIEKNQNTRTPEKKDTNKNEMINENKSLEEEKQLVTPTQSKDEILRRPDFSPEKETQNLVSSKIKEFSVSKMNDSAPLLESEKPKVEEQPKVINSIGAVSENKANPKENIDNWDGVIRLNISAIIKSYEDYAKAKVPKFIKKIQKYIKSLNKHVQTFDIKDEEFLKLKHEVENLRLWNKSWNYSRILLYLYNSMAYFKYNHDINSEVFTKKDVKKTVSLVKKSFFYLREAIRVLCIKFNKDETEAFHQMREAYKATLENKVREYEEEELRKIQEIKKAEKQKQQELKREQKAQNKRQAPQLESKASKKVKLGEDDEEDNDDLYEEGMEVSEEEEEDEEFIEDIPKRKAKTAPKKNKRRIIRGPIIIKKKEEEDDHFYELSDSDLKEQLEVKKSLQMCLNQATNNYKSKEYLASLRNQVLNSWNRGVIDEPKILATENVQQKEVIQLSKMEQEVKQDTDEIQMNDSPFKRELIPDIVFGMPIYEEMQYKPQKLSVFEDEEQSTSAEDQVSEAICSPPLAIECKRKQLAKIFEPEFALDAIKIKQKLDIDFTDCEIDMNSRFEKKLTAIFFCNTIEKKLRGLMKLKGFHYQFNLDHQDDETLSKLVLLRVELKQEINNESEEEEDEEDGETTQTVKKELKTLKVHNAISADLFNDFMNLSDKKAAHAYKLENYDMLIQPWELAHNFQQLNLIDKILNQIHQGPWKKQENCGAYYYAEPSVEYESDSEYNYWDIGILTPVENFFSFHIELNDKLIF